LPAVLLLLIGWTVVWPAPASSQDSADIGNEGRTDCQATKEVVNPIA
jgi:hypothetical protein